MSSLPEQRPLDEDEQPDWPPRQPVREAQNEAQSDAPQPDASTTAASQVEDPALALAPLAAEPPVAPLAGPPEIPLFASWMHEERAPARIPHLGHLLLLGVLLFVGLIGVSILARVALRFHLFGVSNTSQAVNDVHYMLGSMAVLYLLTFELSLLIYPLLWHKGLMAGLQWRARTAVRLRVRLFGAAGACFVLAILNGILMPGPENTPIDKIFRMPGAAWLLFFFGITFAPFFEEMFFRGFLLPAVCTAYDWAAERVSGNPSRGADENGHPLWSVPAMVLGSILVSIPFALMHGQQTSYASGPLLLLVCVSIVLCWVRLSTRSLAASVFVHSCYNFLLFSLMLLGTSGFKHLDKM